MSQEVSLCYCKDFFREIFHDFFFVKVKFCLEIFRYLFVFSGNANTCRQVSNHSTLRDITWSTHNCLITFDTIGIWPETVDGIDLTTGCKNISNTLFVSGDDFGKIKVYSYPVCWPKVRFLQTT